MTCFSTDEWMKKAVYMNFLDKTRRSRPIDRRITYGEKPRSNTGANPLENRNLPGKNFSFQKLFHKANL